jgi:hypothetical protein
VGKSINSRPKKLKALWFLANLEAWHWFRVVISSRSWHAFIFIIFKDIQILSIIWYTIISRSFLSSWFLRYKTSAHSLPTMWPPVIQGWSRPWNLWHKHTWKLFLGPNIIYVVLAWAWCIVDFSLYFFIAACFGSERRLLPGNDACDSLMNDILCILNIVVTWAYSVLFNASEADLIWFLLDQLSIHIFFISKNAKMTWNWGWIRNF